MYGGNLGFSDNYHPAMFAEEMEEGARPWPHWYHEADHEMEGGMIHPAYFYAHQGHGSGGKNPTFSAPTSDNEPKEIPVFDIATHMENQRSPSFAHPSLLLRRAQPWQQFCTNSNILLTSAKKSVKKLQIDQAQK